MNLFSTPDNSPLALRWFWRAALLVVAMGTGAALCYVVMRPAGGHVPGSGAAEKPPDAPEGGGVVRLAEARWKAAGIRVEPAAYSTFTERVWRTGRLTLNETRIAHISPMVEGVVREVNARLGQDVRAGDVLAVIDSREVGQAKLDLVKTRLAATYAKAQHTWTQTTSQAARELVKAMAGGERVSAIEKRFRDRPIGDLRQQLMTAYSRRLQAKAHYDSASHSDAQGTMPQATMIRLRGDYEAAEATFRALSEEVNFQGVQQVRASEQKLKETQTAEALSEATLMMLGFSREEVETMDPIAEGPRVSLYPVRAPFAGTVIEQHAVLAERVGPQLQMFQLADLSTLWLKADVPQNDLALVRGMSGGKLRFRVGADAGTAHEAEVFYTGDVVDKDTRTVVLTASVRNPERNLKPGTFVEVELTRTGAEAVQVPLGAVQRQGTQAFVFVHAGGDEFRRVDVKLGRTSGNAVEVTEGLKAGQPAVVAGGFTLKSEMLKDQMAGD